MKDLFSKNSGYFNKDNRRVLYQALIPKLVNGPVKQKQKQKDEDDDYEFEDTVDFSGLSFFLFFVVLALVSYLWR